VFLSETAGGIREKPAMLGEHTDAILRSLSYAQAQINVLRSQRVI
jgi:crotonobetainyl-CoA:carnitine CoA-transferase CaiB-like acyl-CoA transferase